MSVEDEFQQAVIAYLNEKYPKVDINLKKRDGTSLGWWVWENNSHVPYALKELIAIWRDPQIVREFVTKMQIVFVTYSEIWETE